MGQRVGIPAVLLAGLLCLPGFSRADAAADKAYQEAVQLYGAGNYSAALAKAEAAAQADSRHWQAWQLAGNCRVALNDQANAITEYDYALSINPDNPQLKAYVAQLKASSQPAPAAAAPADHYQLATQAYNAANYDLALKESAEAVKAAPQNWEAWQMMGSARYARADKRGALESYRKSLEINPANTKLKEFADALETEMKNAPPPDNSAVTAAAPAGAGWQQSVNPDPAKDAVREKPKFHAFLGAAGGTALLDLSPFAAKVKEYIYEHVKSSGFTPVITEKIPSNVVLFGVDGVAYRDWYGLKFTFNTTLMKDLAVSGKTVDGWGNQITEDWKVSVGWLEGTVGLFGQLDILRIFYGRAGVNAGLGFADVRIDRTIRLNYPPLYDQSFNAKAETSGLMIPFGGEVEGGMRLLDKFEIFIKAGWESRYAPVLLADKGIDQNGDGVIDSSENETKGLVDVKKNPWPVDLGGVYFQFGARISRF